MLDIRVMTLEERFDHLKDIVEELVQKYAEKRDFYEDVNSDDVYQDLLRIEAFMDNEEGVYDEEEEELQYGA